MAVRTNFEVLDILDNSLDYSITATDKEGVTQNVITSANARQYMKHKYGTRSYSVLTGLNPATLADAKTDFHDDFHLWLVNRQHNIDRMYQALFDYDYSPIENYDRFENETVNTDHDTTYGKTVTEGGTDTIAYGKTLTRTGTETDAKTGTEADAKTGHDTEAKTGTETLERSGSEELTKTGSEIHTTENAGFNSPNAYTPATKTTDTFNNRSDENTIDTEDVTTHDTTNTTTFGSTDTTTYNTTDTHTNNTVDTEGGSDITTHGKTFTDSGSDNVDIDTEREAHIHGNIGVMTAESMIEEELALRLKSLAEMLIDNFMNDYTFYY